MIRNTNKIIKINDSLSLFSSKFFLFLIFSLILSCLPVLSQDTNLQKILNITFYLIVFIGLILILVSIWWMLVGGKIKEGFVALIGGIVLIGVVSYIRIFLLLKGGILYFAVGGFLTSITAGILYFLGYVSAKDKKLIKFAKHFFNGSAVVAFVGICLIEVLIFSQYVQINKLPITECREEINFFEIQRFFFCVFLGYELLTESRWMWISLLVFGFIIPFAVMFSLVYGLFFGMGLDQLFGPYGKPVVRIIAFATAIFGVRQLIGVFLIDLLAYGVWGIFGILIAFIIANSIRFIGMQSLKDIEAIKKSVYGSFVISEFVTLNNLQKEIENIRNLVFDEKTPKDFLLVAHSQLNQISKTLESFVKSDDVRISMYASELLSITNQLINIINKKLEGRDRYF